MSAIAFFTTLSIISKILKDRLVSYPDSQQAHVNRRELFASSEQTCTESLNITNVGSQIADRKGELLSMCTIDGI